MISEPVSGAMHSADDQDQVDAIVSRGPGGALALAGTAVALVVLMWVAFYVLVFLPRN
eukprot:gene21261-22084_t